MKNFFAQGRLSTGRRFAVLVGTFLQVSYFSHSQNTIAYTDPEFHYNKGIELFQKKVYTASREEFKQYIQLTEKTLKLNEFNLINAEYYSALSGLYAKAFDAEIEIERFVVNHSDYPKAKVIFGSAYHKVYSTELLDKLMGSNFPSGGSSFWFEYDGRIKI